LQQSHHGPTQGIEFAIGRLVGVAQIRRGTLRQHMELGQAKQQAYQ
jgi:hypothetical protein